MAEELVGEVTHFFGKIGVALVKASGSLKIGDTITIKGQGTTEFREKIESMQTNHKPVAEAARGMEIGIKLKGIAKEGDKVYLIKD